MILMVMRATEMMKLMKTKITTQMEAKKMMRKRPTVRKMMTNQPRRERKINWKHLDVYSSHLRVHAIFKYMNCTLTLSILHWQHWPPSLYFSPVAARAPRAAQGRVAGRAPRAALWSRLYGPPSPIYYFCSYFR